MTFKTDKLLKSYLASDVSKLANGKDKVVDFRQGEADMGIGESNSMGRGGGRGVGGGRKEAMRRRAGRGDPVPHVDLP
jgi:hypothetical protein